MKLEVQFDIKDREALNEKLKHIVQVAGIKAYEAAVERTPARGEGPYSTGLLRDRIRGSMTGDLEYTLFVPSSYGIFLEFGTGPKGKASGRIPEFPNDPEINYHSGEVLVTRHRGELLEEPYIRYTQGMEAQPYLRPALLRGVEVLKELLKEI